MPLMKGRPRDLEKRAQFVALADAGVTYLRIEEMLDICHATVHGWAREYGYPPRKPGRKPPTEAERLLSEAKKRKLQEDLAAVQESGRLRMKAKRIAMLEAELERVRNEQ